MVAIDTKTSLGPPPHANVVLHREIMCEMRMRQDSDRCVSALKNAEDGPRAVYIHTSLENYRRLEWAAEVVQAFPESIWQMTCYHDRYRYWFHFPNQ